MKQSLKLKLAFIGVSDITLGTVSTIITDGIGPTEIKDGILILPPSTNIDGKSPSFGIIIGGGTKEKFGIDGTGISKVGKSGIMGIFTSNDTGTGTGTKSLSFLGVILSIPENVSEQFSLLTVNKGSTIKLDG